MKEKQVAMMGFVWDNSSPPGQNGRHFRRRRLQLHFLNKKDRNPIQISLKYVPRSPIDNKPPLVQVITWTNDDPVDWSIYAALGGDESR